MAKENSRRDLLKRAAAIGVGAVVSSANAFPRVADDSSLFPASVPDPKPAVADYFPGFHHISTQTSGATIHSVVGGSGPPLLLLHGYPQTHIEWRDVAPELAKKFTVVASDLRGYGDSSKPPDGENHAGYSKRAMGQDHVDVMASLGFQKFAVVGHDRGGRVAHRMALDHADRVAKLMILDIVPTYKVLHSVNNELATANFHWFLLVQKTPLPETLIGNSGEAWLRSRFERIPAGILKPDAFAEYLRAFQLPGSIHASCEDYRAGATIDLVHDAADLDKKIACPVHVLWGERGLWPKVFDVLATWQERASTVTGKQVATGHFIAEERPDILLAELNSFLG